MTSTSAPPVDLAPAQFGDVRATAEIALGVSLDPGSARHGKGRHRGIRQRQWAGGAVPVSAARSGVGRVD